MKKLSKLSLLGGMDLLSQSELRQLVGSIQNNKPRSYKVECATAKTEQECLNLARNPYFCDCNMNSGKCIWTKGALPKEFCTCANYPWGG